MHPKGELISETPSGRGCYVRKLAAIVDLPITQAQRDSSSNTVIIRRMARSDAMCRAFAAAYEVNGLQLKPEARTIPSGMRQTIRLRLAALG
ncbi:MAG: hypothetical protein JOZ58_28625 [Acetobacteraceae bacterium]|nr:hypothetical protein [Acetobacteraceae bacterium]